MDRVVQPGQYLPGPRADELFGTAAPQADRGGGEEGGPALDAERHCISGSRSMHGVPDGRHGGDRPGATGLGAGTPRHLPYEPRRRAPPSVPTFSDLPARP
ncbi:hypothetical protein [Streptomyces sp. NBRC 110035]|uniref:hypothetical protein n=1 Tax=Streptomyces sp. NBRC 110035 TaxID=1547867 RepID=UPI0005A8ACFA|nr:hypothetical protein [Streptomyces sp. NBRC 110035]